MGSPCILLRTKERDYIANDSYEGITVLDLKIFLELGRIAKRYYDGVMMVLRRSNLQSHQ
jgi:hypothetical protein